jgi:alpha-tubulin suppressor-like RCC1 family protein
LVLENVTSVAAGNSHTLAITEGGTLYAWGLGQHGAVGAPLHLSGWMDVFPAPIPIMENVVYAAVGAGRTNTTQHENGVWVWIGARSYAITADGTLYAWGRNSTEHILGILGDGTNENRYTPAPILQNVAQVIPTVFTGFAIKNDNTLWQWGFGHTTPMQVMANVASVHVLDEPYFYIEEISPVFVITADGKLWELISEPRLLLENIRTAVRTRRGGYAIDTYSNLWRLGETHEIIKQHVESVTSIGTSTFAITTAGRLYELGENPVRILENVVSVSLAYDISAGQPDPSAMQVFAVTVGGNMYAWGSPLLGDGTTNYSNTPVRIICTSVY